MRSKPDIRADLPPLGTTRWVASRKAAVVRAVEAKEVSADWAINAYGLTHEELDAWRAAVARHGKGALRTTRLRQYRGGARTAAE